MSEFENGSGINSAVLEHNEMSDDIDTKDKPESELVPEELNEKKVKPSEFLVLDTYGERAELLGAADNFINQIKKENYDSVIFLDRSGRFWAHLIRARWKHTVPEKEFPETKFIKIGREHRYTREKNISYYPWFTDKEKIPKKGSSDDYYGLRHRAIKFNKDIEQKIEELRKVFGTGGKDRFEGERVLIADSFMWSGDTLDYASRLLKMAFPNATFETGAVLSAYNKGPSESKIKSYTVYTDAERKYPNPPSTKNDPGVFIKSHAREIQEIKDKENPKLLKLMRKLTFQEPEKLSEEAQKSIGEHEEADKKQREWYGQVRKEINLLAGMNLPQKEEK